MKNTFAVASFVALGAVISPASAWCADIAGDTAQVRQQAVAIPSLQQAAANAAGYKPADIEVKPMAHQITITVINSKLNSGVAGDRKAEASKIVPAIEKAIAGKPEFGQILMIHVDYVTRQGNRSKIIQGFDFNKTPAGAFVLHQT